MRPPLALPPSLYLVLRSRSSSPAGASGNPLLSCTFKLTFPSPEPVLDPTSSSSTSTAAAPPEPFTCSVPASYHTKAHARTSCAALAFRLGVVELLQPFQAKRADELRARKADRERREREKREEREKGGVKSTPRAGTVPYEELERLDKCVLCPLLPDDGGPALMPSSLLQPGGVPQSVRSAVDGQLVAAQVRVHDGRAVGQCVLLPPTSSLSSPFVDSRPLSARVKHHGCTVTVHVDHTFRKSYTIAPSSATLTRAAAKDAAIRLAMRQRVLDLLKPADVDPRSSTTKAAKRARRADGAESAASSGAEAASGPGGAAGKRARKEAQAVQGALGSPWAAAEGASASARVLPPGESAVGFLDQVCLAQLGTGGLPQYDVFQDPSSASLPLVLLLLPAAQEPR